MSGGSAAPGPDGPHPAPERVVVLAPVADAERLAGLLALARVRADVAPLAGRGCLVAARPGAEDEADAVVRRTSRALGAAPVVVLRADVRAGSGGSVRAEQWVRGARQAGADVERSPGLVLAGLPDDAERVVHGAVRVGDLDGATTSEGLGRFAAARRAAGGAGGGVSAGSPGAPGSSPSSSATSVRAPSPGLPSPVLPAVLAVAAALVLGLEVLHLLSGAGSALVAVVALLGVVLGATAALRRAAARRAGTGD